MPAVLGTSVKNYQVLSEDLKNVLDAILKMYRASIDWFIHDSAIDENIPEKNFRKYSRTFWEKFVTVIRPNIQIHLNHAEPNTTYQHTTMTIRSKQNIMFPEKLIGLKIDVGLEEGDDSKILRITGHTENSSPISEHIRSYIEEGLHATSVQSEDVGRVRFWNTSGALIPNPKFVSED